MPDVTTTPYEDPINFTSILLLDDTILFYCNPRHTETDLFAIMDISTRTIRIYVENAHEQLDHWFLLALMNCEESTV